MRTARHSIRHRPAMSHLAGIWFQSQHNQSPRKHRPVRQGRAIAAIVTRPMRKLWSKAPSLMRTGMLLGRRHTLNETECYQCDTDNEFLCLMIAICVRPRTDGATVLRKHRFTSSRDQPAFTEVWLYVVRARATACWIIRIRRLFKASSCSV